MDIQPITEYINEMFAVQDESLVFAIENASREGLPSIRIGAHEGLFLQFLARACSAKKALEIGTLGGYSGIWIARGLGSDGTLFTIENNAHHAQTARRSFQEAGLEKNVEILVGDAHNLLGDLSNNAPFDFVFIDADKTGYGDYYSWAVDNLRKGGIVAAHNVLAYGNILERSNSGENIQAIRNFNQDVAGDKRVVSTFYPAGDGILAAIKII